MTTHEVLLTLALYRDGTLVIGGHARLPAMPDALRMIADSIEAGATVLTEEGVLGWDDTGEDVLG